MDGVGRRAGTGMFSGAVVASGAADWTEAADTVAAGIGGDADVGDLDLFLTSDMALPYIFG